MKRILILLASMALVASAFQVAPAAAQEASAPVVPEVANIEDPFGDANTQSGDQVLPADGSTVSDLGKIWFSHDAANFNVHILTEGPPGTNTVGLQFQVTAGEAGCAVFSGYYKGLTYVSDQFARLVDGCNKLEDPVDGTFTFVEGPGGAGLATMTFPKGGTPLFADGSTLTAPTASSWIFAGGEQLTPSGYRGLRNRIDDTKPGTDYAIAGGKTGKPKPPGKSNPPGKKKGCDKGKGKKRGCEGKGKKTPKPGKPSAACAPFTPGEAGAGKPTVVLTDAATEAAPLEQKVTLEQSVADADLVGTGQIPASYDAFNIQVDSKAADAGLYALIEFPARNDLDLNLLHTDGSYAARSRAFNPIIELNDVPIGPLFPSGLSTSGHGGESTAGSEKLVGIKTGDCGGWTLEVGNYLGQGGDFNVKLWVGESKIDPQAPGAETP